MRLAALLAAASFALAAAPAFAEDQDLPQLKVTGGHIQAVMYGWSPVLDLWGNIRRSVWTLRGDGVLYFGAPEGSLGDFAALNLTAEQKKECGTYTIDGARFRFTFRDGSPGEGEVRYAADGTVELVKANTMRYFPVGPPGFPLVGSFANTTSFSNAAYAMSTTAFSSFVFHANGAFVLESGAGTTATSVAEYEGVREEVTKFYGTDAKSRMGRYEAKGSRLTLKFEDGTEKRYFLGLLWNGKDGEPSAVLIGSRVFEGIPGKFPADAAAVALATCSLRLPAGWKDEAKDVNGTAVHTLAPADGSGLAVMAIAMDVDCAARAEGKAVEEELRTLVGGLLGRKVESAGDPEPLDVDGARGIRLPLTFERDGTKLRADGIYAVKSGRALLLLAIGTMEGSAAHAASLRALLLSACWVRDETKDAGTADFSIRAPKGWTVTEQEASDGTALSLAPKGVKDDEFFAGIASMKTEFKSAREKKAVAWLRQQVEGAVPGVQKQGELEKLTVDGEPAAGVTYGAALDDGTVVVVHAYAVIRKGKVAVLLTGGRQGAVEKHSGAARRAFETLRMK